LSLPAAAETFTLNLNCPQLSLPAATQPAFELEIAALPADQREVESGSPFLICTPFSGYPSLSKIGGIAEIVCRVSSSL